MKSFMSRCARMAALSFILIGNSSFGADGILCQNVLDAAGKSDHEPIPQLVRNRILKTLVGIISPPLTGLAVMSEEYLIAVQPTRAVSQSTKVVIYFVKDHKGLPFFFTSRGYLKARPLTRFLTRFRFMPVGIIPFGFSEIFDLDDGSELHVIYDSVIEDVRWSFHSVDGTQTSASFNTLSYGQLFTWFDHSVMFP